MRPTKIRFLSTGNRVKLTSQEGQWKRRLFRVRISSQRDRCSARHTLIRSRHDSIVWHTANDRVVPPVRETVKLAVQREQGISRFGVKVT
jgi:hypothetical protein